MNLAVIIPAAGASSRFGDRDKLTEDLGGRPLLHRTVELFVNHDRVSCIVVAGPHDNARFNEFKLRHGDRLALLGVSLCRGGPEHRWQTVRAALGHVPDDCTHIAVHDAARPCASPRLLDRLFDAAAVHDAVIPAVDVADTLKRLGDEPVESGADDPLDALLGEPGSRASDARAVVETVPRAGLAAAQTPQVFRASLLRRAYAQDDLSSTDDAGLVERLGEPVVALPGEVTNIKITRPEDLRLAMAILGLKPSRERPTHKKF
ncbi:MAG: 2-C-methyl-D-erythritol 4-phosphate cytidylyltransferase [Planctomycetota bacterium]|nr:MAG: 2-C-methyl-D-erythritol 4-phosphate cytidylyltransferase [Planctomycetota bacterium]